MSIYCRIADLNVIIESYGRIVEQAKPYLCKNSDNIDIYLNKKDIFSIKEVLRDQITNVDDDTLEYISTGALFYRKLLDFNGMRLHSSAVVVDNKAYLFTANSGTGKSTHTSLWLKQFGDRAYILNDDKPAVRCVDGAWYAYGTPWSGKNNISANCRVPIAGVAVLERDEKNSIMCMSAEDAVTHIVMQVNRSRSLEHMEKVLTICDCFVSQIPIWKLKCNMDPEAAIVSYEAMSGEKFVPTTEK